MQKDLSEKQIIAEVRKIMSNKAYIRTVERENINNADIIKESAMLLKQNERDILALRYIKGYSWTKVALESSYSESRAKGIDKSAIKKISGVIKDVYEPKMYAWIRSEEKFMLHSDEIRAGIDKTENIWKSLSVEQRKERIIDDFNQRIKSPKSKKATKNYYKKCIWLLDELNGDKLEYFLEISHRLIMIDAELLYQEQLENEGDDRNLYYDKEYEECTFEEKAERLYNLAIVVFIEENKKDYSDIRKKGVEYYKDSPIDVLINLKKLEGEELKEYIEKIEPLFDESEYESFNEEDEFYYEGVGKGKKLEECTDKEYYKREYNSIKEMQKILGKEEMDRACYNTCGISSDEVLEQLQMIINENNVQ